MKAGLAGEVRIVLDFYTDTLALLQKIAAKSGEPIGTVLLGAIAIGMAGEAIMYGFADAPPRCTAASLPGRFISARDLILTIALSPEAASLGERIGAECGRDEPIPLVGMIGSFISEGLCDLEHEWLGTRTREWSSGSAEVLWPPNPSDTETPVARA